MKRIIILLVLIVVHSGQVNSQIINNRTIDSLRQIIDQKKNDTVKVQLLAQYSYNLVYTAPEEALSFAQEGLLLANKLKYKKGQILCNISMGFTKWINSDYVESTDIFLQSLKEAEAIKDTTLYRKALSGLVPSYRDHGNHREALNYCFKGIKLFNQSPYIKAETGSVYNAMNMPDSALYYFLPIEKSFGRQFKGFTLFEVGKAYHQKKELSKALLYYNTSIDTLKMSGNIKDLALAYNGKAELYADMGKLDSCIYYAKRGLDIAKKLSYKKGAYESYLLLSSAFESDNKGEALMYYKLAMEVKDDIFNTMNQTRAISARFTNQLQQIELEKQKLSDDNRIRKIAFFSILIISMTIILLLYRNIRIKQKANIKIVKTYNELKSTQSQLIQSEKMASLGELTAGIAHEIQNPLNFVNNFSEVNSELIDELSEEVDKGNLDEVKELAKDIKENEKKINHHGKRADAIVKGMLQHSRISNGIKEPTDINTLADEYLRLSYHGLRAKDKSFNADFKLETDENLPKINVIPQDIGRVLLNLINNAFYACNELQRDAIVKTHGRASLQTPTVIVTTSNENNRIKITVSDNGPGIPASIIDKIFQPFFTTKPTGSGTGLGLSLSYDIVKAHGGEIVIDSKKNIGTEFIITLPI